MSSDDFLHHITPFIFMKSHFSHALLRKLNVATALSLVVLTTGVASTSLFAAATSNFAQVINAGSMSVDIVDANYVPVTSPSVAMAAAPFSFSCQDSTGVFGTATQQIYVQNPDASDTGWNIALAAASPDVVWDGPTSEYSFNDPLDAGCGNGQMTVNASAGTLVEGASLRTDNLGGITKGSSAAFDKTVAGGAGNSITLLTAAAESSDIGDWKLTGVAITQKVPAEQPAEAYNMDMTLSVTAI